MEQEIKTEDLLAHIKWAFRNHEVGRFGHNVQGQDTFGIYYSRLVFKDQLEKMNLLGLELQHIQYGDNDQIIIVVAVRDSKR